MITEITVGAFLILWVSLFFVERADPKRTAVAKYAWAARAVKQLAFFMGIGVFLIICGTDWHNRPWEIGIGIALTIVGGILAVRTCIKRKGPEGPQNRK